jgi:rhomboid-like protein
MFMHGNWSHIIFNMLTLWMFGRYPGKLLGIKKISAVYFICGVAAAGAHLLTSDASAVGASGAIMGLMAAFAYLFPNSELYLFFLPVPIKAKYVIPGLMALDIFGIITVGPGDNVAHWAHLAGRWRTGNCDVLEQKQGQPP